jgi:GTP pyrophosphokinase
LHDVVEDTSAPVQDVEEAFGPRVAELVSAPTDDAELPGEARSVDSMDRCRRLGRDALVIKAADLADNLRTYLAEARRDTLEQLAEDLRYFLEVSAEELGDHELLGGDPPTQGRPPEGRGERPIVIYGRAGGGRWPEAGSAAESDR